MRQKMLKLWKPEPLVGHSHEEQFVERYEQLFDWALRLTEQDHQRAQDLVHDAFVQFVLNRPNLQEIENLDGYLYVTLRNAQLSHARRAAHDPQRNTTSLDYDSLEITLRVIEPITSLQIQNELRLICRYACERKESSKAGSILILRFFRGYYPSEIARILLTSRPVVARWLQVARAEARLYLEDPGALTFLSRYSLPVIESQPRIQETKHFLRELIDSTSNSKQGACLSSGQLKRVYGAKAHNGIDCATLAHLVSCTRCLDQVNDILRLPQLSERYPIDTIDRDKPQGGGSSGGGSLRGRIRRGRRRLKETLEHRPKELRIAANGYVVGSQKISSDKSEQEVSLNLAEPLSFIEIFSEQRLKLLSLAITPPPEGAFDQETRIAFSDDRALEASVKFTGTWPTLKVVYRDPFFQESEASLKSDEYQETLEAATSLPPRQEVSTPSPKGPGLLRQLRSSIFDAGLWLRPVSATAIVAILLIAVVLFMHMRRPVSPLSVVDLLQRSTVAEEMIAAKPDQVLHRTINLEEHRPTGELLSSRKIEVWQSAEKGITARRLFNENGQLMAGDWRRADGVQTLYHHGARPQLQVRNVQSEIRNLDDVWQLDPSAKEFSQLIGNASSAQVEELASTYRITYASDTASGLIRATLVIGRDDLHPIEQTLVVAVGSEQREYRFIEVGYERRAGGTVAPSVFEPDALLVSSNKTETLNPAASTLTPAAGPVSPAPVTASAELEVEVLRLLNDVGADLDDQTTVTRSSDGRLRVGGMVASDQRKAEILRALTPVNKNPAVRIEIETVAEAMRREARSQPAPGSVVTEQVQVSEPQMPAYEDVRKYLGKDDPQIDEKIRQFASRVLGRSSQAMSHAGALKRLIGRFSPEDLRALSPEARSQWLKVVRSHARAIEQDSNALHRELAAVFSSSAGYDGPQSGIQITDDATLYPAAERLFELVAANDRVISSAFSISAGVTTTSAIRAAQFWQSLKSAEALAVRIQNVH